MGCPSKSRLIGKKNFKAGPFSRGEGKPKQEKMRKNMRKIVRDGYEKGGYEKGFRADPVLSPMETGFLDRLADEIPQSGHVLDLGSGTGLPYDKYLVGKGLRVTGVDFSPKHLALARKHVPQADYIQSDFSEAAFAPVSLDAVTAFYSIFHIPRREHPELFAKIHRWLKPGGRILFTLGTGDMECDEELDWLGAPMMWSSYPPDQNLQMLEQTGFLILQTAYEGAPGDAEYHFWLLGGKK
jgi:SAM-dependent methyltransferase